MYLVSVYFDQETEKQIQSYIDDVANICGNYFMINNNVPPHITISAFETMCEKEIVDSLDVAISNIKHNKIEWVTLGTFPNVIFIQPVLNEYLHNLSSVICENVSKVANTKVSKYYKPFSWLPHATIAKQLSQEQMIVAFEALQNRFSPFEGEIVRIELAKKNPYRVIAVWKLNV